MISQTYFRIPKSSLVPVKKNKWMNENFQRRAKKLVLSLEKPNYDQRLENKFIALLKNNRIRNDLIQELNLIRSSLLSTL